MKRTFVTIEQLFSLQYKCQRNNHLIYWQKDRSVPENRTGEPRTFAPWLDKEAIELLELQERQFKNETAFLRTFPVVERAILIVRRGPGRPSEDADAMRDYYNQHKAEFSRVRTPHEKRQLAQRLSMEVFKTKSHENADPRAVRFVRDVRRPKERIQKRRPLTAI